MHADFIRLSTSLMADLSALDSASFKMAVSENLALGDAKAKHTEWESTFCARLVEEIKEGRFDPCYELSGQEAQRHVEEFLEAYRHSFKGINVAVGDLHDGSDEIINISLRSERSLLDRLMNRYGKTYAEINVLKKDITKLSGSSLNFTLSVGNVAYRFAPEGVRRK